MVKSTPPEQLEQIEQIEREDLVAFLNACLAATAQAEFYQNEHTQTSGLHFLHEYIVHNYRTIYAHTLALGINDYNRALIIKNLLYSGAPRDRELASREALLIMQALHELPANRVYNLFIECVHDRRSNARLRATFTRYLHTRRDLPFHIIKYRSKLRRIIRHFHIKLDDEAQSILFSAQDKQHKYKTEIYETYRRAHFSKSDIYNLPYTVAEGMISKHNISRKTFLENIQHTMTRREKERLQQSAKSHKVDLSNASQHMEITRLSSMILSLSRQESMARKDELEQWMRQAARRACRIWPYHLESIGLILDNSYSSTGSRERSKRLLAVNLSMLYIAQSIARNVTVQWTSTPPDGEPFLVQPRGQTNLVEPLFKLLETPPELIIICSDGYENDPAGGFQQVWRLWKEKVAHAHGHRTEAVHMNPIFDAEGFMPRRLSQDVPTVCIRHGEDIPLALTIARFDSGEMKLDLLKTMLEQQATQKIKTMC